VTRVREAIGGDSVLAVKINSADFMAGGLEEEASMRTIRALAAVDARVDIIEITGGTYERMPWAERREPGAAGEQEGYFSAFSAKLLAALEEDGEREEGVSQGGPLPMARPAVMLTGGFRTRHGMNRALHGSADIIGLVRSLCLEPALPGRFLRGECDEAPVKDIRTGILDGVLVPALNNLWHQRQLARLANGQEPQMELGYVYSLTVQFVRAYIFEPRRHLLMICFVVGLVSSMATAIWFDFVGWRYAMFIVILVLYASYCVMDVFVVSR